MSIMPVYLPQQHEETQVFGGKAVTSFRAPQSPAVSNLQKMVPQLWRIHSPHMQTRGHYPLNSLALLPQLGIAWPNPAVKQQDRTGVCVSEQWATFEQHLSNSFSWPLFTIMSSFVSQHRGWYCSKLYILYLLLSWFTDWILHVLTDIGFHRCRSWSDWSGFGRTTFSEI